MKVLLVAFIFWLLLVLMAGLAWLDSWGVKAEYPYTESQTAERNWR